MGNVIFVVVFGVLGGALLGSYLQLYYAISNVSLAWKVLANHALAKRQALVSLAQLLQQDASKIEKEIAFLSEHSSIPWRKFLRNGYTILFAFREMEESLPQFLAELLDSLDSCENQRQALLWIENFWARENLFSFEIAAYEQAVEKYLKLRRQGSLWCAQHLFRFLDLPEIRLSR